MKANHIYSATTEKPQEELLKRLVGGLSALMTLEQQEPLNEKVRVLYNRLVDESENITLETIRTLIEVIQTALDYWQRNILTMRSSAHGEQIVRVSELVSTLTKAEVIGKQLFDRMQAAMLLTSLMGLSSGLGAEQKLISAQPVATKVCPTSARMSGLTDRFEDTSIDELAQRIHEWLVVQGSSGIDLSLLHSVLMTVHHERPYRYFHNVKLQAVYDELVARADPSILELPDILWYVIMRFMDIPTMLKAGLVSKAHSVFMKKVLFDVLQDKFILSIRADKTFATKPVEERGVMLLKALKQRALKFKKVLNQEAGLTANEKRWFWACFIGQAQEARALVGCDDVSVGKIFIFESMILNGLTIASREGHVDIVQALLVVDGVDVNAEIGGKTPLYIAAQSGQTTVIKVLLDSRADVNYVNKNSWTALVIASQEGHTKVVECLLDHKANVYLTTNQCYTAFLVAMMWQHPDIVEALFSSITRVPFVNYSSLLKAAYQGSFEMVKKFYTPERNVVSLKTFGLSPLLLAAAGGHLSLLKWLHSQGASITETTSSEQSALMIAARMGHLDIVEYLLGQDIEKIVVDAQDSFGSTALIHAIQGLGDRALSIIKLLHNAGASLIEKKIRDRSPLVWAIVGGHNCIIDYLIRYGASLEKVDSAILSLEAKANLDRYLKRLRTSRSLSSTASTLKPGAATVQMPTTFSKENLTYLEPLSQLLKNENDVNYMFTLRRPNSKKFIIQFTNHHDLEVTSDDDLRTCLSDLGDKKLQVDIERVSKALKQNNSVSFSYAWKTHTLTITASTTEEINRVAVLLKEGVHLTISKPMSENQAAFFKPMCDYDDDRFDDINEDDRMEHCFMM